MMTIRNLEVTEGNVRKLVLGTLFYLQSEIDKCDKEIATGTCMIYPEKYSTHCLLVMMVTYDPMLWSIDLNLKNVTQPHHGCYMIEGEDPIQGSRFSSTDVLALIAINKFYTKLKDAADKYTSDNILFYNGLIDLDAEYCISKDGRIEKIEKG